MKVKLALLAAVGSVALTQGASAQGYFDSFGEDGFYAGIGAGIVLENDGVDFESTTLGDIDISNTGVRAPGAFDTELDLGDDLSIYGVLGAYLPYNFRVDIEAATRQQDVDAIFGDDVDGAGDAIFSGFQSDVPLGDITVTTIMSNLYYDFDLDLLSPITPYLGAGFGTANVRLEIDNLGQIPDGTSFSDGGAIVIEDDDWVIAGQAMGGLTYDFTENMMVDLRYRYLHTGEADLGGFLRGNDSLVGFETEYKAHEIVAGLRWNFGATPPPAAPVITYKTCFDGSQVPVTAECPTPIETPQVITELDPLVVYFDFDRSNLTDAARTLIAARAEEAIDADVSTVTVQGNTDTSGSSAYNQALSARRANVVADALVANGISQGVINVQALGESNPAKPTGDGVREPLNRRTEVLFDF